MLKKTITYEDFDGKTVTEEFNFHLSKLELIELEVRHEGGLRAWLDRIIRENDKSKIMEEFKKLILMTYGQREGNSFIKSPQARDAFVNTEAFSELLMEIGTNDEAAAAFINGIVPRSLADQVQTLAQKNELTRRHPSDTAAKPASKWISDDQATALAAEAPTTNVFDRPTGTPENPRVLTRAELMAMDYSELKSGLATGRFLIGAAEDPPAEA